MSRIKDVMKEKGFTQQMLADSLGVSLQSIKITLSGKHSMTEGTFERIAKALNVPVWELFVNPNELNKDMSNSASCPHCGKAIKLS